MEVLQWNTLSPAVQVKLLFLLDTGDVTSQDIDYSDDLHVSAPEKARDAFLSVLQDRQHSFACVTDVLRDRVKHLLEYRFISASTGKDDEDLLTLVHACHHLHVEYHYLEDKIKRVREKLSLTEKEMEGNLFIYSENLRMLRLCDVLTARQVAQLLALTVEDKTLGEFVTVGLEVSTATLKHTKGLKEAVFFYLIRTLELNNKLNRIYTNKLERLLEQLQDQVASEEERRVLSKAITSLGDYTGGGRLAGHCVVFWDTHGIKSAQADIEKIKHVFGKVLGYTVYIVKNPDKDKLEECLMTLRKPKYKFYDSIVYWFIPRSLMNDFFTERDIIEVFSKVSNFRKTPKIFFMTPILVQKMPLQRMKSLTLESKSRRDASSLFLELAEDNRDITAVYYQMDRLVARATFTSQDASLLPDGGSVYVDTVCRLLVEHRGHNITQVLQQVTNILRPILLSVKEKFPREVEQECCYESTLQKTFCVP